MNLAVKKSLEYVSFDGYIDFGDYRYLSCNFFNGLIRQSKEDGVIDACAFPEGPVFSQLLHHRVFMNGSELVFSPDYSYGVHTFDLNSNKMNYYVVKKDEWENYRCSCSHVWNNKLWMFLAYGENGIVSMDLETHNIEYYPDAYKTIRKYVEPGEVVFWSELCINDGCVYGVINNKNYIVQINLEDISVKIIELEMELHLSGITINNSYLYMTEYNTNDILIYDIQKKTIKRLDFPFHNLMTHENGLMYSNIVSGGGIVLAVHNYLKSIFEITTEEIKQYGDFPDEQEDINTDLRRTYRRFYSTLYDDNKIELYPARSNMMISIDISKKKITGNKLKLPSNWIKHGYGKIIGDYFEECSKYNVPITESDLCDINDFINYLDGDN